MKIAEAREVIASWSKRKNLRWDKTKAEELAQLLAREVTKGEKRSAKKPVKMPV